MRSLSPNVNLQQVIAKMIFNWIVCVSNIKPAVLWAGFVVWPWPILVSFVICTQEKNITVKLDQLILCAKRESVSFHLICFQIMFWIKFCECHSEELNEVNALSIALKVLLDGERCLLAKVLDGWIETLNSFRSWCDYNTFLRIIFLVNSLLVLIIIIVCLQWLVKGGLGSCWG